MKNIKNVKTLKLVLGALFTALTALFTFIIPIKVPLPGAGAAYIHPGDCVIFVSAYILGGPWAILASAIGSGLADIIVGAAVYAPAVI